MPQIQEQILSQQQTMQQRLTPQQLLIARMIEMPLAELEENVRSELNDNPSLDGSYEETTDGYIEDEEENTETEDTEEEREREEREDALNEALENMGDDDRMEVGTSDDGRIFSQASPDDSRQIEDADSKSFLDTLYDQMHMEELTEEQELIMEYLIGSLDDAGLLTKDITLISDELAIYHNTDVTEQEIEEVLGKLQTFDPAGVGAQSLQQCLLLQVERREDSPMKNLLKTVLSDCFEDFSKNHMSVIQRQLDLSDYQMDELRKEIKKLNPKPGAAYGEVEGRSLQQITPDFIVQVDYDGRVSFELNNGRVPKLHVVKEDEMFLKEYQQMSKMSKGERDAMEFTQKNVTRAHYYIDALHQRQRTMILTMKAIIDLQRQYFIEGDEADLKPMVLKDVADRTGLDQSTISRVSKAKYAQTPWGTFKLRHFFSAGYSKGNGEVMATKAIKAALREVIEQEDKRKPLSDQKLVSIMQEKGYPIARRTITKYREQMNIPTAKMRKL